MTAAPLNDNPPPDNSNNLPTVDSLPPEAINFATRMFNAARQGQTDIFEQALPAGLPANLTNEKGDSLVRVFLSSSPHPHPL